MPLSQEPAVRNPQCIHVLHRECAALVLRGYNKCPYCRCEWYSDTVAASWARMIEAIQNNLEKTGEFFGIRRGPIKEEYDDYDKDESLSDAVNVLAHCIQAHNFARHGGDYDNQRGWDKPELRREALQEEVLMREAAASEDGYQLVGCLIPRIQEISLSDLSICASVGTKVYDFMDLSKSIEIYFKTTRKMIRSDKMRAEVEGHIDIWFLGSFVTRSTVDDFARRFGQDRLTPPLRRFLQRLIMMSLIGCTNTIFPRGKALEQKRDAGQTEFVARHERERSANEDTHTASAHEAPINEDESSTDEDESFTDEDGESTDEEEDSTDEDGDSTDEDKSSTSEELSRDRIVPLLDPEELRWIMSRAFGFVMYCLLLTVYFHTVEVEWLTN